MVGSNLNLMSFLWHRQINEEDVSPKSHNRAWSTHSTRTQPPYVSNLGVSLLIFAFWWSIEIDDHCWISSTDRQSILSNYEHRSNINPSTALWLRNGHWSVISSTRDDKHMTCIRFLLLGKVGLPVGHHQRLRIVIAQPMITLDAMHLCRRALGQWRRKPQRSATSTALHNVSLVINPTTTNGTMKSISCIVGN